ncbi:MAG: hypothetical protein AB1505_12710 [Candidatus Latescibacterota bacterium]
MGSACTDIIACQQAVEAMIREEERVLLEVVRLLQTGVCFAAWPAEAMELLRAALTEGENGVEAQRSRTLTRHLFRSRAHSLPALRQADLPPLQRRIAERIRADLAGLVPLGCGVRCLR